MSVLPAWLAFEAARKMLERDRDRLVRICYIVLFLAVGGVILVFWEETWNVASTYAEWEAGDVYSFWTPAFAAGWAVTAAGFWIAFFPLYRWLHRKS